MYRSVTTAWTSSRSSASIAEAPSLKTRVSKPAFSRIAWITKVMFFSSSTIRTRPVSAASLMRHFSHIGYETVHSSRKRQDHREPRENADLRIELDTAPMRLDDLLADR